MKRMFWEQFLDFAFCKINKTLKNGFRFWMTVEVVQRAGILKQLYQIRAVIHLALFLSFDGD